MIRALLPALVLACLLALPAAVSACGCPIDQELVVRALSPDPAAAAVARVKLRAAGPLGLEFVDHQHRDQPGLANDAGWDALYDDIGQQRGCRASRLYWYTDLAEAEAAARVEDKPIVSLRLLGKLTDEFSCANSRFFRVALYADPEISAWLREHVILHWSSERAAPPQLTIDFGDGRSYRGTIGGNSAHLVLDAEGRPVDVLPGLYGPRPFLAHLRAAVDCAREVAREPARRDEILTGYHRAGLEEEERLLRGPAPVLVALPSPGGLDDASAAQALTFSKALVEVPFLDAIGQLERDAPRPLPAAAVQRILRTQRDLGTLSTASRDAIARQLAGLRALGAPVPDDGAALAAVQRAIAADTVVDEYGLHREIHRRFISSPNDDFAAVDAWLYANLFRTPASDPWLGLMPRAWDGLDHGVAVAVAAQQ